MPARSSRSRRSALRAVAGALLSVAALASGCKRGTEGSAPAAGDETLAPYRSAKIDWRQAAGDRLVIAMNQHMETDALKPQLRLFKALSGIDVRIESYPENELHDKTLVDLSSRQGGFDVVMMDFMFTPQYAEAGLIEPLDAALADPQRTDAAWFAADDFVPALVDAARYKGKLWALPFTSESTLLFYRKDLLAKAGVSVPHTFDELAAAAKKLHDPPTVSGIGLRGARGQGMNIYVWTGFLRGMGGDFFAPDSNGQRLALDAAPAIAATELYARLLRESGPRGAANWTWLETLSGMQEGRIAMCIDASNFGPVIDDPKKSSTAGKWGYAEVPAGPAGSFPAIYTHTLAINAASKHKLAAWLLVSFVTSRVAQRERALVTGEPTRRSVWEDAELKKRMNGVGEGTWMELSLKSLARARADYRPRIPAWREIGDLAGIAVQQAIAGEKGAADALSAAQTEASKALAKSRAPEAH